MRTLVTLVLSVLTLIFLIFGYSYWKGNTKVKPMENSAKTEDLAKNEHKKSDKANQSSFMNHVGTWPDDAIDDYQAALDANEVYKFAIVGSQTVGDGHSWAEQLKEKFETVFAGTIEVKIFEFDSVSTVQLIEDGYEEVVEFDPNLVLFETLSLSDNTALVASQSGERILEFAQSFDDATVILQPSHPIHGATIYPTQIDDQEAFITENGFTYLNHWSVWPDSQSDEIRDLLSEDQRTPSEKGHELWFNYLQDYFFK